MTVGLLLLAAALGLSGYNIYQSKKAENISGEVAEEITQVIETAEIEEAGEVPDYVRFPKKEMPSVKIKDNRYVGVLEIPSISLELPVMAGEWSYAKLNIAPCQYVGSIYEDNMVIAAHNYRSHFGNLNKVKFGSLVRFTDVEGHVFEYEAGWADTIQPTDMEGMNNAEDWDLTLFTCNYSGNARYTLRCIRLE